MITKNIIKKRFNKEGLKIDKIVRTKLGDGFFVYHPLGMEYKILVYRKIKNIENGYILERCHKIIKKNFISNEEDGEDLLDMVISEAKNKII